MNNTLKVPSLQSLIESDRGSNDSLLADSLQLDIEELDDEEYAIPQLGALPTLENVLTEMAASADGGDDSANVSEFAFTPLHSSAGRNGGHSADPIAGTASALDTVSMAISGVSASSGGGGRMGTILRHVQLQGVSAQLASAADRINTGLATCAALSRPLTAVGTSHGHVLAFDSQQTLRWCWSPSATTTNDSQKSGSQQATQQGACAALAFNADSSRLLAGFSRGLLIMIDCSSGDTLRTMPDLITPNTGVLNLHWTELPATALCSDSGGSVWTLQFTRRLGMRGAESRCIFSGARGEVCTIAPLCFAADTYAQHPLRTFCIAAMATLTKFVVVTVRPRLRVIKYRPLAGPAQSLPLLAWQMVLIQTAASRTVDPVLCAAHGRSVFFHQLCLRDGRLHLLFLRHIQLGYDLLALHWLGPKTVAALDTDERLHLHDIRANRELETIDMAAAGLVYAAAQFKAHATGGNVSPALALAGSAACYNSVLAHDNRVFLLGGRSLHSVSVRAWSERVAHLWQHGRWVEACSLAVDGWRSALEGADRRPDRMVHARETIRWLVAEYLQCTEADNGGTDGGGLEAVVECLVTTGERDLLWSELWERTSERPERYLRALTRHILRGCVAEVAPVVGQALCAHWQRADPERLEQVVLQLDWRCLDLHQVLTAVRRERLWQAQIHLNATALGDYCASLVDLVPLILEEDRRLGNYLLVYISSCLAGRGYPRGEIAVDLVPQVKHEVLRCLTAVHSNGAPASELPYPYLRTLLHFDTRDTLNVLSLAFEEKEFSGELGQSHRQRIVHILLEIMSPDSSDSWPEIGTLLNFIAQQIASRSLPAHGERDLLDRVMGHLRREHIADETAGQHAEREHGWLELLSADCLTHITMGDQFRSARAARCYRVVQLLLERRKCYDDILPCYLDAAEGRRYTEMWTYMRRWAPHEERQIFAQICAHLEQLLRIDCEALVRLVMECFEGRAGELLQQLDGNESATLRLMQALDAEQYRFGRLEAEKYLQLLCAYSGAERVQEFLESSREYRFEVALEIVRAREPKLGGSLIYLYEQNGQLDAALDLCMQELMTSTDAEMAETHAMRLSAICTQASGVFAADKAQHLWFSVIDAILARADLVGCTRAILHEASKYVDLAEMVQRIMDATPTPQTATTPDINAAAPAGKFGDIRQILEGVLLNARYESQLLRETVRVQSKDLHDRNVRARRQASRGVRVSLVRCVVCDLQLTEGVKSAVLVLGGCGHAVHCACWPADGARPSSLKLPLTNGDASTATEDEDGIDAPTVRCPRCGVRVPEDVFRPAFLTAQTGAVPFVRPTSAALQLEAPPRIGIGGP